jgi:Flp pilus assembly protein TadG
LRPIRHNHKNEQGQTLVLVALSLFTLFAMAALAIDLTTLYVARAEMQRAADAAALAAGKAFVESGTTTAPLDTNLQGLARLIGNAYINAVMQQNKVGGSVPVLTGGAGAYDFTTHPGNPQVTVTLQRTDVPTYFAHLFGRRVATVSASATAEAYNSSAPPGGAGANMPPVAPSCVKPWLIPNADPRHTPDAFIDENTGELLHPEIASAGGIIGEEITLRNPCLLGLCGGLNVPVIATAPNILNYLPAQLAAAGGSCPSCAGGTAYEQGMACCDTQNPTLYQCGRTAPGLVFNLLGGLLGNTVSSVECLIGATSTGPTSGQDEIGLGTTAQPPGNTFGNFLDTNGNDPIEIRAGSGPHSGQTVNTSPSIVTLPIYGVQGLSGLASLVTVHIVGYMQAFVAQTDGSGQIDLFVLNISGCGPNVNAGLPPVVGGGISPVPVRLIHQ